MKVKVCLFTVLILLCSCSQFADYNDYDPDNIANVNNGEGMDLTQFGKVFYNQTSNENDGIVNCRWRNSSGDNYWLVTDKEIAKSLELDVPCVFKTMSFSEQNHTVALYGGSFKLYKKRDDFYVTITIDKKRGWQSSEWEKADKQDNTYKYLVKNGQMVLFN